MSLADETLEDARSAVKSAMDQAGLNRNRLARRMGRSRAFVTQTIRPQNNFTLKTLARLLEACGYRVEFHLIPLTTDETNPTEQGSRSTFPWSQAPTKQ